MKVMFLPGAGASPLFWKPVADSLNLNAEYHFFSWPGLGNEPSDPKVSGLEDLIDIVIAELTGPTHLIAQSMGGYIAVQVAIRKPDLIRSLVLTATSAGLPMAKLGASEWHEEYRTIFPNAANWITEPVQDLTDTFSKIEAPCLLLWGDCDTISPVSVGERLQSLLPNSELDITTNGDHDLAIEHASIVAAKIQEFISKVHSLR